MTNNYPFQQTRTAAAPDSPVEHGRSFPLSGSGARQMKDARVRKASQGQVVNADGRMLRSERTRFNIVSAYLFLVRRNLREPSMRQVAEVAGWALRSVYERMSDTHTLRLAALDHALNTARRSFDPRLGGLDWASRLQAIVRFQVEEYEQWGPLWHLMIQHEHLADIKARLETIRHKVLKDRLDELYRHELTDGSEAEQVNWLLLLNATTSLESWQSLRYFQQLTFEGVCERWGWCVERILAVAAPNGGD